MAEADDDAPVRYERHSGAGARVRPRRVLQRRGLRDRDDAARGRHRHPARPRAATSSDALSEQGRRDHQLLHQLRRDRLLLARAPPVLRATRRASTPCFMMFNLAVPRRDRVHAVPDRAGRRLLGPRDRRSCSTRVTLGAAEPAARSLMLGRAPYKAQLFRERTDPEYFRYGLLASSAPVVAFAALDPDRVRRHRRVGAAVPAGC